MEGTEQSLDKPRYSLIFPDISVVPKISCRDVEHAVIGIRTANSLHWLSAWGIIDNDSRTAASVEDLANKGVYALPFFSVESDYYHPEVIRRVVERHSMITGEDADAYLALAQKAALNPLHLLEAETGREGYRRKNSRRDVQALAEL